MSVELHNLKLWFSTLVVSRVRGSAVLTVENMDPALARTGGGKRDHGAHAAEAVVTLARLNAAEAVVTPARLKASLDV